MPPSMVKDGLFHLTLYFKLNNLLTKLDIKVLKLDSYFHISEESMLANDCQCREFCFHDIDIKLTLQAYLLTVF